MNFNALQLVVSWPELRCFSCQASTCPEDLRKCWTVPVALPPLETTGNTASSGVETHIVGLTAESVVKAADEAGWRKITMYGKTLYICPNCIKNRVRPEWARRLTEEDAK